MQRGARVQHVRAAAALRRGWPDPAPGGRLHDGGEHRARPPPEEGARPAVPLLPLPDRHRNVAAQQQLPLPQLQQVRELPRPIHRWMDTIHVCHPCKLRN